MEIKGGIRIGLGFIWHYNPQIKLDLFFFYLIFKFILIYILEKNELKCRDLGIGIGLGFIWYHNPQIKLDLFFF